MKFLFALLITLIGFSPLTTLAQGGSSSSGPSFSAFEDESAMAAAVRRCRIEFPPMKNFIAHKKCIARIPRPVVRKEVGPSPAQARAPSQHRFSKQLSKILNFKCKASCR